MTLLKSLMITGLAAASFVQAATARMVPVLSEPRSIPLNAISYDAWGDTLIASRYGASYRVVRHGDEMVLLDSLLSDSIRSEMPRTLRMPDGTQLQTSERWINVLDWDTHTATPLVKQTYFGYDRVSGGIATYDDTAVAFLCGDHGSYLLRKDPGKDWEIIDEREDMGVGSVVACDVDPETRQAVRLETDMGDTGQAKGMARLFDPRENFSWYFRNPVDEFSTDSVMTTPQFVFAAYGDRWLAWDQHSKVFEDHERDIWGVTSFYHELLPYRIFNTQPVRRDSLVVLGGDSSLILIKWTPQEFKFLQAIPLGGKTGHAMAWADSTLWVQVGARALSFRISWKDRTTSSSRSTASTREPPFLSLRGEGTKLTATWSGREGTPLRILGMDGSVVFTGRIEPNSRLEIPLSGRRGVLVAQTNSGTRTFVSR
ncbi:MAG: hypothetical protein H6686_02985 [Fibrobacteria bacterium]|nr:hypothetical protein [Fibrobacteria bacterium]